MKWLTKLHKSKTMLFNILVAVLGIVEMNMQVLQEYLGTHYGIIFMLVAVVNVILRTVTTKPLNDK